MRHDQGRAGEWIGKATSLPTALHDYLLTYTV